MSEPTTVADLKAAIEREYGTYVANQVIYVDGARAFNPGDPVPASHVTRGVVDAGQVTKTTTETTPDKSKG